jgi:uncharacterized repeat protein (TIGR01451 family)
MRYLSVIGLGLATLGFVTTGVSVIAAGNIPFSAAVGGSSSMFQVAQKPVQQQAIRLLLTAELQTQKTDEQGNIKVAWQVLENGSQVVPGSLLRYVVTATNSATSTIPDLVVIQPIPSGMTYIIGSATLPPSEGSSLEFSIDSGKTFVAKPTVTVKRPDGVTEVRPAPADFYRQVGFEYNLPSQSEIAQSMSVCRM